MIIQVFIVESVLASKDKHVRHFWKKYGASEGDIEELVKGWNASRVTKNTMLDRKLFIEMLYQLRAMIVAFEKTRQTPENTAKLIAGEWNDWRAKHMNRDEFVRQFMAEAESRQCAWYFRRHRPC